MPKKSLERLQEILKGSEAVGCMDQFPFTDEEWHRVEITVQSLVNAKIQNDDILSSSQLNELVAILGELRQRYGEHPVLRETEADFLDDPLLQIQIYRDAVCLAGRNSLPTISMRMSLARLLAEEFEDWKNAAAELNACKSEMRLSKDEYQCKEWLALMDQCMKRQERT